VWTEYIRQVPSSGRGYQGRAKIHFDLERYDEALADLERALEVDPSNFDFPGFIDPARVAKCPDPSFRDGLLALADKALAASGEPWKVRCAHVEAFAQRSRNVTELVRRRPGAGDHRARERTGTTGSVEAGDRLTKSELHRRVSWTRAAVQ